MLDREDIFCNNCHVSMRIDDRLYNKEAETYKEAREQAIEAWNRRTTTKEDMLDIVIDNKEQESD